MKELTLIKEFRIQDVDIEEWHRKHAKNNYYIFKRGIETLGIATVRYGSYRFYPRLAFKNGIFTVVELLPFDMMTIAKFLKDFGYSVGHQ